MRIAILLAFGALGLPLSAVSEDAVVSPERLQAARFHAEGLGTPLGYFREGEEEIQSCNDRFAKECSEVQREAATGNRLRVLDLIKTIPTKSSRTIVPIGYPEFRSALRIISEDIVRETLAYDGKLFARFGATLQVCPPDKPDEYRTYLANMQELTFRTFGGFDENEYAKEYAKFLATIDADAAALATTIRTWKPAECEATRFVGAVLAGHLYAKLEPWNTDGAGPSGIDPVTGAATDFLLAAAVQLEKWLRPELLDEMRKLSPKAAPAR